MFFWLWENSLCQASVDLPFPLVKVYSSEGVFFCGSYAIIRNNISGHSIFPLTIVEAQVATFHVGPMRKDPPHIFQHPNSIFCGDSPTFDTLRLKTFFYCYWEHGLNYFDESNLFTFTQPSKTLSNLGNIGYVCYVW